MIKNPHPRLPRFAVAAAGAAVAATALVVAQPAAADPWPIILPTQVTISNLASVPNGDATLVHVGGTGFALDYLIASGQRGRLLVKSPQAVDYRIGASGWTVRVGNGSCEFRANGFPAEAHTELAPFSCLFAGQSVALVNKLPRR